MSRSRHPHHRHRLPRPPRPQPPDRRPGPRDPGHGDHAPTTRDGAERDRRLGFVVDHFAAAIEALDAPPIIMGHSFGGVITQLLLARGLGAAGVVINSAPTEGVHVSPPSQLKSLFPALRNPGTRHRAVAFTPEQFHYAFTNTLSAEDSQEVWGRYTIAAPGYWIWEYGVFANIKPGHQETWVDYDADRAPLLFIAGGRDHIMPPSVNRSNAKHYKHSPALTEYFEFEDRDHWTCGAPGWEAVADHALEWALEHAVTGDARAAAS